MVRDHWTTHLPIVFLGIRSSLKPDINRTAQQSWFGTPLRLPAKFFDVTDATILQSPL